MRGQALHARLRWFRAPGEALMLTYANRGRAAHLVHRAVFKDPTQALVGKDRNGGRLRPVTVTEQEAFAARDSRRPACNRRSSDERVEDDLVHQLGLLTGGHWVTLPRLPADLRLARLSAIIGADPALPGRYLLDVPAVKVKSQ
jgi:hypothetical protein